MTPLSSRQATHFGAIGISPDDVGELVGAGAQNMVWALAPGADGEERVIKAPQGVVGGIAARAIGMVFSETAAQARHTLEVSRKHFPGAVLATEIAESADGRRYALIQPRLRMEQITSEVVAARAGVRDQVLEIMARDAVMLREERLWLDVIGWNPKRVTELLLLGRPYMDNLALCRKTGRVRIFDTGLFPAPETASALMAPAYKFLLNFRKLNLRKFKIRTA